MRLQRLSTDAPAQASAEKVRVHSEHPGQPVVEIPVFGVITGDVTPARRVDFGLITIGVPATAKVQFPNRGSREVEILGTELHLTGVGDVKVPAEIDVAKNGRGLRDHRAHPQAAGVESTVGHPQVEATVHADEAVVQLPVAGAVMAKNPFDAATTPEGDARLRGVVADALRARTAR